MQDMREAAENFVDNSPVGIGSSSADIDEEVTFHLFSAQGKKQEVLKKLTRESYLFFDGQDL